jgi:hypothetical protein
MFGVDPGVRRLLYGRQCCLAAVAKQQICSIWHLAHASFAENMELSLGILRRKVARKIAPLQMDKNNQQCRQSSTRLERFERGPVGLGFFSWSRLVSGDRFVDH